MQLCNPCSPVATPPSSAGPGAAPSRPRVPVSTLYSTLQCILSMVGSIGVILLFAGIPQLIYSSSVQISNLMTFLLGASLITAMVAGNAFVNYKYRQYCSTHQQVARDARPRAEGSETTPDKTHADEPPDYFEINEHPPSYQDVAAMYQWRWGHVPERRPSTVSTSTITASTANINDPQGPGSPRSISVVAGPSGETPGKRHPSEGQINCAFESSCSDLTAADGQKPPSRKISAASITDELKKHQFFSKFMRSSPQTPSEAEASKSQASLPEQHAKKNVVPKQRKSNLFTRSPSEGDFESLPPLGASRRESFIDTGGETAVESLPCGHSNAGLENEVQLGIASCSAATAAFECGGSGLSSARSSIITQTCNHLPDVHITVADADSSGPSDVAGLSLQNQTVSSQQGLDRVEFRLDYGSSSSLSDCEEGSRRVESFSALSSGFVEAPPALSLVSYDPAQPSRNVRRSLVEMYGPAVHGRRSASSLTGPEEGAGE